MTKSEGNFGGETSAKTKRTPLGKGFRNLFASTTVAAFGGSVSTVAVSYIVYHVTPNPQTPPRYATISPPAAAPTD